jgi:predicted Rossmann fold nucleotide-binding protein DprA/Smf involved in DNA uptake
VARAAEAWRGARGEPLEVGETEETAETRLWRSLEEEPQSLEALALRAGVELPQAMAALLALQWSGAAAQHPGQRWARVDP